MKSRLALAAVLFLIPLASAQDGCTESQPCDWVVSLGTDGFLDAPADGWNFTAGDWVLLDVFNEDDVEHRITVEGHPVDATVGSIEQRFIGPFQWQAGSFTVTDQPSGDTATATAYADDFIGTPDAEPASKSTPGPAPLIVLCLLALLARR